MKNYHKKSLEEVKTETKELVEKLEQGVAEVFEDETFKKYLSTMARFPKYSFNNVMLIFLQCPEASLVQSFTGWKKMNRSVKKGEKGIRIFAPSPYKVKMEEEKEDEHGNVVLDTDGNPKKEVREITHMGFKAVSVFDVSQTEGEKIPYYGPKLLQGEVDNFDTLLDVLKSICPVPIAFEDITNGANGYFNFAENRIAIRNGMEQQQIIKTVLHEMTHQKLHSDPDARKQKDRETKEVEAESTAFVVCNALGIDTSDYSFAYVAGWSKGKEMKELKESLDLIAKTASEFIDAIEKKCAAQEKTAA